MAHCLGTGHTNPHSTWRTLLALWTSRQITVLYVERQEPVALKTFFSSDSENSFSLRLSSRSLYWTWSARSRPICRVYKVSSNANTNDSFFAIRLPSFQADHGAGCGAPGAGGPAGHPQGPLGPAVLPVPPAHGRQDPVRHPRLLHRVPPALRAPGR